jgi:predicted ArsR family transcriptional regulator
VIIPASVRFDLPRGAAPDARGAAAPPVEAAGRQTRDAGHTTRPQCGGRAPQRAAASRIAAGFEAALADEGFEPARDDDGTIRLRNCPFHTLANQQRELVCGMNLALIEGVLSGARVRGLKAVLDPKPGMCCVALKQLKKRAEA